MTARIDRQNWRAAVLMVDGDADGPDRPSERARGRRRRGPVDLRRGDGYWVWVGGPVPPGSAAITIGPVVVVRKRAADNARLLRHELVHVRQWREHGVAGFLARYLGGYVRARGDGYNHWAAYRRIPFEIEAEWISRREGSDRPVG